jgi:hypothetical protein
MIVLSNKTPPLHTTPPCLLVRICVHCGLIQISRGRRNKKLRAKRKEVRGTSIDATKAHSSQQGCNVFDSTKKNKARTVAKACEDDSNATPSKAPPTPKPPTRACIKGNH